MKHTCSALMLHCIDFRFAKEIKNYMEANALIGDCDIVAVAGAAKNIASPAQESDRAFILKQIEISKRLHDIKKIILINHTDCGAYGGSSVFESKEKEHAFHAEELENAEKQIKNQFPEIEVKKLLAIINPESSEVTVKSI